ncbi:MAG: lytic transglycosylase domain-containing protein [Treponema sp.]|jgi:soluble lytic murein transglycosylase-like protein|nr:lytic transglycosylase domain-containing protein [Treponema sp.]
MGSGARIIAMILSIAIDVGVDGGLGVLIARRENRNLIPAKVGCTGDLGIMQLNPRYLDYFVSRYWDKDWEFDWKRPYDNIYVGLKHLKYLQSISHFTEWQSILAYNAGEGAVRRGTVKDASIEYANAVYLLWKTRR